jgi:hypothetical protein
VKVTVMGQFPPAASELPQVLVWPKSPGLAPVNPTPVMDRGAFPVLLRVTVWVALGVPTLLLKGLVVVTPATGPLPVPVRLTLCVLPATLLLLSVMIKEAERLPSAAGVNVMLKVQFPPAASELPQVLVWPKSPGLAPVNPTLVMDRGAFPVLLRVTVWVALGVPTLLVKGLVVVIPAMGSLAVPVRLTVCGLPAALSAMLTEAVRLPSAAGVNVTLNVQLPPFAATELPQVLVVSGEKSPLLAPVTEMLVMDRVTLPLFVRVTVCDALAVPTPWLLKLNVVGLRLAREAVPVPARVTD